MPAGPAGGSFFQSHEILDSQPFTMRARMRGQFQADLQEIESRRLAKLAAQCQFRNSRHTAERGRKRRGPIAKQYQTQSLSPQPYRAKVCRKRAKMDVSP